MKLIWYFIEAMVSKLLLSIGHKKDSSKIPFGDYCYFSRRGNYCPYYRSTKKTGGIACTYLGFYGTDFLLYDQCKICGIKEYYLEDKGD